MLKTHARRAYPMISGTPGRSATWYAFKVC
jgi:hypothetical protein